MNLLLAHQELRLPFPFPHHLLQFLLREHLLELESRLLRELQPLGQLALVRGYARHPLAVLLFVLIVKVLSKALVLVPLGLGGLGLQLLFELGLLV